MMNEDRVFFRYFSSEFDGSGAMGVNIDMILGLRSDQRDVM